MIILMFSAPAGVWYTFIYFGHDNKLVSVLDGNFKKWLNESRPVSKEKIEIKKTSYKAKENLSMIVNKDQVKKNILNRKFQLIDARSKRKIFRY